MTRKANNAERDARIVAFARGGWEPGQIAGRVGLGESQVKGILNARGVSWTGKRTRKPIQKGKQA